MTTVEGDAIVENAKSQQIFLDFLIKEKDFPRATPEEYYTAIHAYYHQQLQKARHDWLREEIVKLEGTKLTKDDYYNSNFGTYPSYMAHLTKYNQVIQTIIDRYQFKLEKDVSK